MKKRVQVTSYGTIHYIGACFNCDFQTSIQTDGCQTRRDVRESVRNHVLKTGHMAYIESGDHSTYRLVEG